MAKKRTIELTLSSETGNYDVDDVNETDDITVYTDNGSGGTTVGLTNEHDIPEDSEVTIANSATAAYNGTHIVFNVDAGTGPSEDKRFDIPVTFDDNPADGDISYNRHSYDIWLVSHIRANAPGHTILAGDKDDPRLRLLAHAHSLDLNFKDS